MSLRDDILKFLQDRVGQIVTTDQIMAAVGYRASAMRRVRELRRGDANSGQPRWDIRTHYDDHSLRPNEYKLASLIPLAPLPANKGGPGLVDRVRSSSDREQLNAFFFLRKKYGHLTDAKIIELLGQD